MNRCSLLALVLLPACMLDFSHGAAGDLGPNTVAPSVCGDGTRTQHEVCGSVVAITDGSASDAHLIDVTGDGLVDLVYVVPGSIIVRAGNGHGGFAAPTVLPGQADASYLAFGDIDNDGRQDIVTAGANTVTFWRGDGSGAYPSTASDTLAGPVLGLGVGHTDGSAADDIVLVTPLAELGILFDNGTTKLAERHYGTMQPQPQLAGAGTPVANILVEDIDGDGYADVGYIDQRTPDAGSVGTIEWMGATGSHSSRGFGGLDPANLGATDPHANITEVAAADIDGDGEVDYIASQSEPTGVVQTYSRANGVQVLSSPLPPVDFIVTADLDGDGRADVIAGTPEPQQLLVLFGATGSTAGSLFIGPAFELAGTIATLHADADANGDGIPDPIVTYASGDIAILLSSAP